VERTSNILIFRFLYKESWIPLLYLPSLYITEWGGGRGVQMVLTEPLPLMKAAANGVYSNAKTLLDVKFIYHFGDSITVTILCWYEYNQYILVWRLHWYHCSVMSKTKGQTFRYRFGNETSTFWYRSRICLIENRLLFQFGPESALLDQIEMISFDEKTSGTNSKVLYIIIIYRNACGTFVEHLFLYCFDITTTVSFKTLKWNLLRRGLYLEIKLDFSLYTHKKLNKVAKQNVWAPFYDSPKN
jgi:hypothetical protein